MVVVCTQSVYSIDVGDSQMPSLRIAELVVIGRGRPEMSVYEECDPHSCITLLSP